MTGGSRWEFGVLGPLTAVCDGEAVDVRGRRPREVLALLLMQRGRALSLDRLIDELWGEESPASAQSAVHVHLSKVRSALGDLVTTTAAGYVLDTTRYTLDADRFAALAASGDYAEALALWRGDPLADLTVDRGLGTWRDALLEQRLRVTMSRIDAELAAGAAAELLAELAELTATNPFEERLVSQQMVALYRAGRAADALDAFARVRKLFASELGLNLGQQLTDVQTQILNQDPGLLVVAGVGATVAGIATVPEPEGPPRRISLPRAPTRLVGREEDLANVLQIGAHPECRLITLTGPGGVGKTRLAVAVAQTWGEDFADGALFVGLAGVSAADQVAPEIAVDLARRDELEAVTASGLNAHLAERELLLVLDNFEQVIDAATLVAELLAGAPALSIIVTSRVPLRIRGEHVYEVEPLALPREGEDAAACAAVELFADGARAANHSFHLDAATVSGVVEICQALDGLPLAIELAAAASRRLPVQRIAAQLSDPLTIGGGLLRDLPDRHRTLEAAIHWSYTLLAPEVQQVLRAASVFQIAFTPQALGDLLGRDCTAELDELVEASLMKPSAMPGRYRLLVLVKAFAAAELERAGEAGAVKDAHLRHFRDLYAWAGEDPRLNDLARILTALTPELPELRAALDHALTVGDRDGVAAIGLLHRALWIGLRMPESTAWMERILTTVELPPETEMLLVGAVCYAVSQRPEADEWLPRMAARAAELGDSDAHVLALSNWIALATNRRDLASITPRIARLEELLSRESCSPRIQAAAAYQIGVGAYVAGDYAKSVRHAERALALGEEDESAASIVMALTQLLLARSALEGVLGNRDLRRLLTAVRSQPLPDYTVAALWLAARYAAVADPEQAVRLLAQAERVVVDFALLAWPESQLRDEAQAVLGIGPVPPATPDAARDLAAIIDEVAAWLETRDPDETVARTALAPLLSGD